MQFNATVSTVSGGSWLSVFPRNAISDASAPNVPAIRVDVDPTGLTAGIYYGTVQISAPSADNTPQFVSVILNVLAPGSKIGAITQPSGLIYTGAASGDSPGSQTVLVQNTGSTPLTFTSSAVTNDGASWLTSLPRSGTVSPGQSVRVVIQPLSDGLTNNVYRGTLTLSFSDGNTRAVAVVLVLAPPGTIVSHDTGQSQVAASCTPTKLAPVFTLTSNGFAIPTGFPGQVAVKVVDDCANPMTTGDVIVSFSNGDSPIRLVSLKDGNFAGTWTPVNTVASVTVTADASISSQNLKGQVQIRGSLQANNGAPLVASGGVVNAASFAAQAPIAPGSLVSIFGANLAQPGQASSLPLPMQLGGSSVVFGGQQAPLVFTSNGQVNAMVPYGLGVNTSQQVIVAGGSTLSTPQPVTMASAAPGIFILDAKTNQGAILGPAAIADVANPVKAGDAIVIFCTGLGEVNPPVTTGSSAPASPLSFTVNTVTATVGGASAKVLFSGLSPGFVGLYQVNAIVPSVAPGSQVPVVLTAAGQSSPPANLAIH
jgi:uncharacterized protein (TIGR03437 family)